MSTDQSGSMSEPVAQTGSLPVPAWNVDDRPEPPGEPFGPGGWAVGNLGYAVDGLVAGVTGLLVAEALDLGLSLVGWVSGNASGRSPLLAVGAAFVDLTPAWLKEWAVSSFGTGDKAVLFVGMAVVLALLFAAIGMVARRRHTVAAALVGGLGVLALAAQLTRAGASPTDPIPLVVGLATTVWMLRRMAVRTAVEGPSRREALGLAAAAAGVALAESARGSGGVAAANAGASRAAAAPVPTGLPAPASAGAEVGVPGVGPWVVPNDVFYRIDTALVVPRLATDSWRLRVYGEVEREVSLTWEQLLAKPLIQRHATLACVSNEVGGHLVGNALWTGWPVRELLREAGPKAGADMVLSRSVDGWTAGTPLEALTDDRDALLAVAMNGEALPFDHGFPVRLVVPGLYGYVSATKWVPPPQARGVAL